MNKTFIQHPFSKVKGHQITIGKLLSSIEHLAADMCGAYYEIFEEKVLSEVEGTANLMNETDKALFIGYAKDKGFDINRNIGSNLDRYTESELVKMQKERGDEIPF